MLRSRGPVTCIEGFAIRPPLFGLGILPGPKDLFAVWPRCSIGIPLPFLQTPPSRVDAVQMDRGKIFIHSGKGKEDRYTILAAQMKETLVEYLRSYKPRYWPIEGRLEKKSGTNRYATVHRLRPALATQLPERRNMQGVPGYASVNTAEIYTHVTEKGGNQIQSPLDHLELGHIQICPHRKKLGKKLLNQPELVKNNK
jgi:hypothetical protein